MGLIKNEIPRQNFELVRDRIGEILAEELHGQSLIVADASIAVPVFLERFIPFDKTEVPCINVSLSKGDYSNKDQRNVDGSYTYFVDVYASAKSTDEKAGDVLATIKLHRILGMCRAILENPSYNTLGFARPFSGGHRINSILIADPVTAENATHQVIGRLEFIVRVTEGVELKTPLPIASSETGVKLFNTTLGYVYITQAEIDNGVFTEQFTEQFS